VSRHDRYERNSADLFASACPSHDNSRKKAA
jgi:hypothetical protein